MKLSNKPGRSTIFEELKKFFKDPWRVEIIFQEFFANTTFTENLDDPKDQTGFKSDLSSSELSKPFFFPSFPCNPVHVSRVDNENFLTQKKFKLVLSLSVIIKFKIPSFHVSTLIVCFPHSLFPHSYTMSVETWKEGLFKWRGPRKPGVTSCDVFVKHGVGP